MGSATVPLPPKLLPGSNSLKPVAPLAVLNQTLYSSTNKRALKLWMVLRMYGADKLRELIRHHLAMAAWLVEQVRGGGGLVGRW